MQLQKNGKTGIYDAIWKPLVCIDIIKEHFKKAKTEHIQNQNLGFLAIIINSAFTLA